MILIISLEHPNPIEQQLETFLVKIYQHFGFLYHILKINNSIEKSDADFDQNLTVTSNKSAPLAKTHLYLSNQMVHLAQTSRLFGFLHPTINDTDIVITSDMDLFPTNISAITNFLKSVNQVQNVPVSQTNNFILSTAPISKSESEHKFRMLAISQILMPKSVWREVLLFEDCLQEASELSNSLYVKYVNESGSFISQ